MAKPKPFTCSICQEEITGQYPNNAWPINGGCCCNSCDLLVTAARIRLMRSQMKGKENG